MSTNIYKNFNYISSQAASDDKESYFFRVAEAIFVGWFSLEYIVR